MGAVVLEMLNLMIMLRRLFKVEVLENSGRVSCEKTLIQRIIRLGDRWCS